MTRAMVIGATADEAGIVEPAKMSELLHDLLANAFSSAPFKKGYKIELRASPLSKDWCRAMLKAPELGLGPDCWKAVITEGVDVCNGALSISPVFLSRSTGHG